MKTDRVSEYYAKDRAAWHEWLAVNHRTAQSVWLVYDKGKARTLPYDDIVEEALCFGWIDSIPGKVNDRQSKIYVSRRKPKSAWSKTNKERVERLIATKRMMPAGLEAIKIAKQNGAWEALNASDRFEEPPELQALLAADPRARQFYDAMPPSSHRIILEWIYQAKTEATKQKRITETVELAVKGIKAHHYRQ